MDTSSYGLETIPLVHGISTDKHVSYMYVLSFSKTQNFVVEPSDNNYQRVTGYYCAKTKKNKNKTVIEQRERKTVRKAKAVDISVKSDTLVKPVNLPSAASNQNLSLHDTRSNHKVDGLYVLPKLK